MPRRPTYAAIVQEMEMALRDIEEAAASLELSGALRFRLLRRANEIRALLRAAKGES